MKGEFSGQYNVTVGVEFASKSIKVDGGTEVKLQIWDTVTSGHNQAGQEAFRAIVRSFYKGIAAVFLSFSLTSDESLDALRTWVREVKDNGHEEVIFFLVGTKADLEGERKVSAYRTQEMLTELGAAFYIETSAKTNSNIEEVQNPNSALLQSRRNNVQEIHGERSLPRTGHPFRRRPPQIEILRTHRESHDPPEQAEEMLQMIVLLFVPTQKKYTN